MTDHDPFDEAAPRCLDCGEILPEIGAPCPRCSVAPPLAPPTLDRPSYDRIRAALNIAVFELHHIDLGGSDRADLALARIKALVPEIDRMTAQPPGQPTEGPWFVHDYTASTGDLDITVSCAHPDEVTVCSMGCAMTGEMDEVLANAHLIAAAHDLRDALQGVSDMLFARSDIVAALRSMMGCAEHLVCEAATAALAKARGKVRP